VRADQRGDGVVDIRDAIGRFGRRLIAADGGLARQWLITASRTGRGGKAAPALLKWRTLATPGVSDLSNGTSSVIVMTASS